jgi:hypothetical protein
VDEQESGAQPLGAGEAAVAKPAAAEDEKIPGAWRAGSNNLEQLV